MARYGPFAELASDPGSAFLAKVVQELNSWLGIYHRVSLVDIHESNGCKSTIKGSVRHIRTIALDYRLEHCWSRPEVIDYVMFVLNARPHTETGVSPFLLKFGTTDNILFRPDLQERYDGTNEYITYLDSTLATVRQVAQEALDKGSTTRQSSNPSITTSYQPGDFLIFGVPKMNRTTKLATPWLGPYEVSSQRNNNIECRHLSSGIIHSLHCNRVKIFMGTRQEAYDLACLDNDQHTIVEILAHGPT